MFNAFNMGEKKRIVQDKVMTMLLLITTYSNFLQNITMLEQPPYSSDLAPRDFFLFPKLKGVIKGTRFQESITITTAVMKDTLSNSIRIFLGVLRSMVAKKCIQAQRDYFAGDKL